MAKICKCDKIKGSGTTLATPGVKKKNEMYLGSSASTSTSKASSKTSATMGHNGIGKVGFHCPGPHISADLMYRVRRYLEVQETQWPNTRIHAKALAPVAVRPPSLRIESCASDVHTAATVRTSFHSSPISANLDPGCAKCALPNMKTALVAGQKFTLK